MLKGLKELNLPEIEEKVLKFWKENQVFQKSLDQRKKSKPFRFFEGPPTANGLPGIHHVLARSFKDVVVRYKAMRGYYVPRKAGWDTHGLPVEIMVEKELGFKSKSEIEKFGIGEFNARAKDSVWRFKGEWEKMTERVGFWLDTDHPYITYENKYIETLWWILAETHKGGFLKQLYKIVPWCPRCQTPLSSHELGQPGAYKKTQDPSVYVKFKIQNTKSKTKEFLLVWTTTPWTLPANMAIALNPKVVYTKFKVGDEFIWSYNPPPAIAGKEAEVVEKVSGQKLVGLQYEPLYPPISYKLKAESYSVLAADFVSTEDGSGFVHIAPAFGEDDLSLWKQKAGSRKQGKNEEILITVNDEGVMANGFPGAGRFIKQADKEIVADLERRGLMHQAGFTEHEYPFCWRCSTPLIYLARYSWFIEMSRLRNELIKANEKINWIPEHIKEGRFGEWLREVKDWAISRNRYWGTPLPIWQCGKCEHQTVIGSLADLDKYAPEKNTFYFARHTQSDHNIHNMLSVWPETNGNASNLTTEGIKQAEKLAKEVKKKKINVIYASPFARTQQTAEIIAKETGAKIITDKRLAEINAGIFNGKKVEEFRTYFPNKLEMFTKPAPEGESWTDVRRRVMECFLEINAKHEGETILIVSHADPLFLLNAAARGLSNEKTLDSVFPLHGELYELPSHNWPYDKNGTLDVHRPFIDEIHLKCEECGAKMERVKEVADVWFDSGAMPFAQWHYPFENKAMIDKKLQFPADYISEGIDQTRGWFYTMLAISLLLKKGVPYQNVISLGLLLDKNGQKMSKSKGNVVDPWQMINKYGADVLRWYFFTVNDPGDPKRFDELDLSKVSRRVFQIVYNSFVFYETYRNDPAEPNELMDKWILASLSKTVSEAQKLFDDYRIGEAAKRLEQFVDDLSRWYIRRTRKNVSPKVLAEVLTTLAKLMAPFAPFFAEALYKSLKEEPAYRIGRAGVMNQESVHLSDWPVVAKSKAQSANRKLLEEMAEVRRLAALGLAEREKAGIKVRQPLASLKIKNLPAGRQGQKSKIKNELLEILKDEINVKEIVIDKKIAGEVELDTRITPELRNEGILRELVRTAQGLRRDSHCKIGDLISLYLEAPAEVVAAAQANLEKFKKDIKAGAVEFRKADKFDAELKTKIGEWEIWLGLKK